MLVPKNEALESRNFIDCVDFTKDDPCIFVVYPAGSSGDLLISIVDKHYLRTGCEYYGIADNGKVHMYTTDYEFMDQFDHYKFDDTFFYHVAESLGKRNLNYSLLDQVIFGTHMWRDTSVNLILDTFSKAKVIRILPHDERGNNILHALAQKKLGDLDPGQSTLNQTLSDNPRVLEIPFGSLFDQTNYYKQYDRIINFLNLNGRLICFDYVQYYLTRQGQTLAKTLEDYSKTI
ncbi:hypothetical protein OAP74_01940 [bacterium]|nr:hypothetical protein [bacterium]